MNQLTQEKEEIKAAVKSFTDLITNYDSCSALADQVDEAIWRLSMYLLSDSSINGAEHLNYLCSLKMLRDVLNGKHSHS